MVFFLFYVFEFFGFCWILSFDFSVFSFYSFHLSKVLFVCLIVVMFFRILLQYSFYLISISNIFHAFIVAKYQKNLHHESLNVQNKSNRQFEITTFLQLKIPSTLGIKICYQFVWSFCYGITIIIFFFFFITEAQPLDTELILYNFMFDFSFTQHLIDM